MNKKFVPLNEKIRILRLSRKKTQDQVAKALSITRSCLSNYENGTREPDISMLKSMAAYFDVEVDYFFNDGNLTLAMSETDKEEYVKLLGRVRKVNSTINTEKMSLSSKIALHSFYEYLTYCDSYSKKRKRSGDKGERK